LVKPGQDRRGGLRLREYDLRAVAEAAADDLAGDLPLQILERLLDFLGALDPHGAADGCPAATLDDLRAEQFHLAAPLFHVGDGVDVQGARAVEDAVVGRSARRGSGC
jgi:hypothetical protein